MPPNFPNFLTSRTFRVESRDRSFFVHGEVLATHSQPLYNSTANEPTATINLSDWDRDTVERLLQFLYVGDYQVPEPTAGSEDQGNAGLTYTNTSDTAQPQVDWMGWQGGNILLIHVKVYVLARSKKVEGLRVMALERLTAALEVIGGELQEGSSKAVEDVVGLLGFICSIPTVEEPVGKLVSEFVVKNSGRLLGEVAVRLSKATASNRRVLELEAINVQRVGELEALQEEIQLLMVTSTETRNQLRGKIKELEVAKRQVKYLEIGLKKLQAASSAKMSGSELPSHS